MTPELLRDIAAVLRRASGILGWAALGEFVGHFAGLAIPDTLISDTLMGHVAAVVLMALGSVGALARPTPEQHEGELRSQLAYADLLFLRGLITEGERNRLRERCLEKLISG
jgi:hypothetical protein